MARAGVKDRLTGVIVYMSKPDPDYYTVRCRAEAWCRRHLKDRGTIIDLLDNGSEIRY